MGKRQCGQNNPFGFGQPCWNFPDYPAAIRAVANTISTSPTYAGYQKTHDLISLSSVYNGGDSEAWANTVATFQEKIRKFN